MELSKKDIDFLVSILKKYIDTSLATITNRGRIKVHHFEEQYMRTVNGGLPLDQSLFRTYLQTCGKVNVWIDSDKTGELPTDGDQDVLYFLWVDGSYVMYIYTDTYVLITGSTQAQHDRWDDTYTKTEVDTKLDNIEHDDTLNLNGNPDFLHITETEKTLIASTAGIVSGHNDDIEYLETNKADKATTLGGYGITDAYTQTEINTKLENIKHEDTLDKNGNPDFLHVNEEQKALITSTAGIVSGHTEDIENLETNKADKATTLGGYGITDAYTKTEIDNKISAVFRYKGSVQTYADLIALTGMTVGDVYNVTETGDNYAWTGIEWDKLSGEIDLSAYLTTDEASNTYETIENVQTLSNTVSEHTGDISDLEENKQDKLTAGENIVINDNVISADLNDYLTIDGAINTYETIENVQTLSNTVSEHTGDISDLEENKVDKTTDILYADLLALIANNGLIPGQNYRITDYTTTTTQANTQSAGHDFDIIVTALSTNELSENAKCVKKADDTYFTNANLEAWEIKYCIDNDTSRFAWADTENGKGVIYYMKDENGNECPYDFKNIQFKYTDNLYYYTFSAFENTLEEINDASLMKYRAADDDINGMTNNVIKPAYTYLEAVDNWLTPQMLNNIIFKSYYDEDNYAIYLPSNNSFGVGCYDIFFNGTEFTESNKFGDNCFSNTFGNNCNSNTFGNDCYSNKFGDYCGSNTFGYYCRSNTFGYYCRSNTFGNNCNSNTFGNNCNSNTFGNSCYYNTFGNYCSYNTFGYYCRSNTFGDFCYSNTFGDSCYYNTFGYYCDYNTFGDGCRSNTFGDNCDSNTFGNDCQYNNFYHGSGSGTTTKDYIRYIVLEDGCRNNNFYSNVTTSSNNYLQRIRIKGLSGTSSIPLVTQITLSELNTEYYWEICYTSDGELKQYCPDDNLMNNYSMPSLSLLLKKRTKKLNVDTGDYEYYNPNIVEAPNDLSDTLNYVNDCIFFNVNGDDNILKNLDKYYINIMRFNKNGNKRSWKILDDRATVSSVDWDLYDYFKDYFVYSVPLSDCEMTNISLTTGESSTKGSIQFKYPYRVSHLLNRIFYIRDNSGPIHNIMELMNLGTNNDSNPNGLYVGNPGAKIGSDSNFYNITPNRSSLSYPVQFVLTYGHPAPKTSSENPSGQRQAPRSNTVPGRLMVNPIKYKSFMEPSDPNYDLLKDEVTVNLTLKLNNK